MDHSKIPDLPSDEELGIAGMDEEPSPRAVGEPEPVREETAGRAKAGTPPATPARPWRGPLTLGLLLAVGFATGSGRALPDAAPLDEPTRSFSSGRAMLDLVDITRRAHPTGSPEHERVREVLLERLRALGMQPEVQTATSLLRSGERVQAATVRNVLARLPGTASTGAIVLTAHYDGRGHSRAAGDDGTGVVAVLETLRALREGPPLQNDVIVLLTDGEELGLLGARAFVADHPWMEDVAVVLSVEMRGGGGPALMFETGAENGWILRALDAGAPGAMANSLSQAVYRRMPNDTDFTPFARAGVQGLNFAGIGRSHVYHQAYDTPERLDERTLQHHGEQLLGMARELGGRDLTDVDAPDRTYFRLPLVGLVTYPTAGGYGVAVVLAVAFVLLVAFGRRRGAGWGGIAVGAVLAVAGVGLGAALGWGLFEALRAHHPEYGTLHGSAFHAEGPYMAALLAATAALVVLLLALARRRFGLGALALGASVLPVAGALALTFLAPEAAMNLQWPALAMLGSAALVAGVGRGERPGMVAWLLLLPLAAFALAFLVPVTELLWVAASLAAAPLLGAVVGLGVVLLLPTLDVLREPGGGWAPVLGLVATAVLVGAGLLGAAPSAERPAPSTLVWALDRDAGTALWASREDAGLAWAGARAGELGSVQPLEGWLLGDEPWRTGRAPLREVAAPRVVAVVDSTLDGRRRVSLAVRSEAGAELLAVRLPGQEDVYLRRVNGVDVPDDPATERQGAGRASLLTHWGMPADEEGVTLELNAGASVDALTVEVIEHHLRPGEIVGERPFLRPPSLAPNVADLSDRAVLRTRVPVTVSGGGEADDVPGPATASPDAAPAPADSVPS